MAHLLIAAIGRLKGPYGELCALYANRLTDKPMIRELVATTQQAEAKALIAAIPAKAFVVALDERGQDLSSRDLAAKLANLKEQGARDLVFLIGGADGLTQEVRDRANLLLGLGRKTWPHKLARVMLLEQLYRAQQINAGHPYHREG